MQEELKRMKRNKYHCLGSLALLWSLIAMLTLALGTPAALVQSNSGQQTVDFEDTSGPSVFGTIDPPLTQGVATFS
jgi:hypothetical protein